MTFNCGVDDCNGESKLNHQNTVTPAMNFEVNPNFVSQNPTLKRRVCLTSFGKNCKGTKNKHGLVSSGFNTK